MTASRRQLWLTVLVAFAAGLLGAGIGVRTFQPAVPASLHDVVHHDLALDKAQEARIEALETSFAGRRRSLEAEMRSANAELARAIAEERGYGPRVTAAVDHFHGSMGRLQKETIEHVFAMRAVMTPEQAAQFDKTVVKALTVGPA